MATMNPAKRIADLRTGSRKAQINREVPVPGAEMPVTYFVRAPHPPAVIAAGSPRTLDEPARRSNWGWDVGDVDDFKPRRRGWTDAERWQVYLAAAGLIVAIIAAVGQFVR
ncbi:hypothetical protein ACIQVO_38395 [Streptomyces sp. NPDC101062]|uniref:hypothetical protein n=1 Tax=unclassified Streptomyces TaxID=2593676 RepID=UPI0037F2A280